jgi:hypothetical protein
VPEISTLEKKGSDTRKLILDCAVAFPLKEERINLKARALSSILVYDVVTFGDRLTDEKYAKPKVRPYDWNWKLQ